LLIVSFLLVNSVKKEVNKNEELHKLAINLNKANQRLQLLDRQKTEFLSIASHQLRTPLSIIKGYGELIRDGAYGEVTDQVKHVLTDMDDSNERLVKLVDEFLNITRIEQGRTKYTFEMSDLNETIDSIVAELKPKAEKNDTKIIWKPTKRKRMYCFDEEKVRHIIFNFVDNAIKYGKGTPVHVKVKPENGGVSVRITDKGMGFDKEDGANFFNKFYRGKNVQGTNVNGTGLGIYVCKQFAEAHRGKVWADSPGLGKGSEFGFFMPKLDPKHPPKPKIDKDKQFVVNQYGGESLSDEIKAVL
jgi:signal transduction histidine kinase